MNQAFSAEAISVFLKGLEVTGIGMSTVLGVLFVFYLLIKFMIKLFPEKD